MAKKNLTPEQKKASEQKQIKIASTLIVLVLIILVVGLVVL